MRMETYIRKDLGMKAHRVVRAFEEGGVLVAEVERCACRKLRCGRCGLEAKGTKGRVEAPRRWRDLSLGGKWLVIEYWPYRVVCRVCGVSTEGVP